MKTLLEQLALDLTEAQETWDALIGARGITRSQVDQARIKSQEALDAWYLQVIKQEATL